MNVLVLSAYDAESHRRWHQGLVKHLSFSFTVMALPPRFFSWRIRGNAMSWALGHRDEFLAKKWDAIVATSMVDLATLKGLVPALAVVPTLVYFHENQFSYPVNHVAGAPVRSIEPQIVTLYSALSAEQVVFNSSHNKITFLSGVAALLKKLPDEVPNNVIAVLEKKSMVIPVPLEASCFEWGGEKAKARPLTLLWNHRWEYDKGPERLFAVVQKLVKQAPEMPLCFHIVGQQFRQEPAVFADLKALLTKAGWFGEWGFLPTPMYQAVLVQSDIVLSTALHDFQGLAVLDAVAAGCTPLLPRRVAYPDFFAAQYLYDSMDGENYAQETQSAVDAIKGYGHKICTLNAPDVTQFSWQTLAPIYHQAICSLVNESLLDIKTH